MIRDSEKEVIYNFPLFFVDDTSIDPGSSDSKAITGAMEKAKGHLLYAAQSGAKYFTYASCVDLGPAVREERRRNFLAYSCLLGEAAKQYGLTGLIEPFDRSIGKNLLIGPTREAVQYIEKLREWGIDHLALMIDMGHIPLIGDSFSEAVALSIPYLYHVHMGNCVKKNMSSIYYGDKHPPFGIDGGENDMLELVEFLTALINARYLKEDRKNNLSIEMQPYPGVNARLSAQVGLAKINTALKTVMDTN